MSTQRWRWCQPQSLGSLYDGHNSDTGLREFPRQVWPHRHGENLNVRQSNSGNQQLCIYAQLFHRHNRLELPQSIIQSQALL